MPSLAATLLHEARAMSRPLGPTTIGTSITGLAGIVVILLEGARGDAFTRMLDGGLRPAVAARILAVVVCRLLVVGCPMPSLAATLLHEARAMSRPLGPSTIDTSITGLAGIVVILLEGLRRDAGTGFRNNPTCCFVVLLRRRLVRFLLWRSRLGVLLGCHLGLLLRRHLLRLLLVILLSL